MVDEYEMSYSLRVCTFYDSSVWVTLYVGVSVGDHFLDDDEDEDDVLNAFVLVFVCGSRSCFCPKLSDFFSDLHRILNCKCQTVEQPQ